MNTNIETAAIPKAVAEKRKLTAVMLVAIVVLTGIIFYLLSALGQSWENERALDRRLNNYNTQ